MAIRMKFRDVPPDFGDRFPDGDYTVGRGADPRGLVPKVQPSVAEGADAARKPSRPRRGKKAVGTAAE